MEWYEWLAGLWLCILFLAMALVSFDKGNDYDEDR